MKKVVLLLIYCSSILCLLQINSYPQWEPDARLTNDTFISYTNNHSAYCIAVQGDTVHIVWTDNSSGIANETRYRRSTDKGLTWDRDTILTSVANNSWSASITVIDQYVYVVWVDQRDGNDEIYFKASSDAGVTWTSDDRIINSTLDSQRPSVAATGSDVHVVFRESGLNQPGEIRYRRSTDYGDFWVTNTQLTNDPAVSDYPKIAASGQIVHVVWNDGRDGNYEIYYKRSSDRGVTWGLDTRLTLDANSSVGPNIAVSGSNVHLLWNDNRNGFNEIFYKLSTDGGLSWSSDTQLTINDSSSSFSASVAVSGSVVHIVWMDERDGNRDLYHKRSTNNGTNWSDDERLTNDPADLANHSAAISGSAVYTIWTDYRDGSDGEIYFKRNPTGEPTEVKIVDNIISDKFVLYQNYPNPFNPNTTIEFSIREQSFVKLEVFNTIGERVSTLVDEKLNAGNYKYEWSAGHAPSGIYFYRVQTSESSITRKMTLLK
jgi:hypothetical protein